MKGPGIQARLADQNRLAGWRECRRHRFGPPQYVGSAPTAVYRTCTRCPVTIRRTARVFGSRAS